MAKRKRLSPAAALGTADMPGDLETKALNGWVGVRPAPIADVSRDAATHSAFEEVAGELRAAKEQGRMVMQLPLDVIDLGYLVRDRIALDDEEMTSLIDSLRDRGQQTPIEVIDLGQGQYGLISGWRRMKALGMLLEETGDNKAYGVVQALLRAPQHASEAYVAMVEENEVRADLSFYERAHIALKAVELGLYPDVRRAVSALFKAARPAKRSKISAFALLVEALDGALSFPNAIPEKLGLELSAMLAKDGSAGRTIREALRKSEPASAQAERVVLDRLVRGPKAPKAAAAREEIAPDLFLEHKKGRVTLSGAGVDKALLEDLKSWISARA